MPNNRPVITAMRKHFKLPDEIWAFTNYKKGEVYICLGNQPEFPETTKQYWNAVNVTDEAFAKIGKKEKPPEKPGYFLPIFKTREILEKFRTYSGIGKDWKAHLGPVDALLEYVMGSVPFVLYYHSEDMSHQIISSVLIDSDNGFRMQCDYGGGKTI